MTVLTPDISLDIIEKNGRLQHSVSTMRYVRYIQVKQTYLMTIDNMVFTIVGFES